MEINTLVITVYNPDNNTLEMGIMFILLIIKVMYAQCRTYIYVMIITIVVIIIIINMIIYHAFVLCQAIYQAVCIY